MNDHGRIRPLYRRIGGGLVRNLRKREEVDRDLGNIKMQIPTFQGQNNLKAYLNWEKKIELIYDYHNYSKEKKMKFAMIEFINYSIIWWD